MISRDREAKVLRLHGAEKWPIGTIASQLDLHHSTVRRVLAQAGLEAGLRSARPSIADPYVPFIMEQLEKYPKLCASRLYQMVKKRGYPGAPDHFEVLARALLEQERISARKARCIVRCDAGLGEIHFVAAGRSTRGC